MTEGGRQTSVEQLIAAAVLAGMYGSLARKLPESARGLDRMRLKHHERGTALCGEICEAAELDTLAVSRVAERRPR